MNQKNNNRLTIALVVLCIAFVSLLLSSLKMYQTTNQKLEELLAAQTESNQSEEIVQTAAEENSITFLINSEPLEINLSESGTFYNAVTLNTDFETIITTSDTSHEILVNGQPMTDGSCKFMLEAINNATRITLTIDGKYYYIRTLPNDLPSFTAVGESASDGFFYTTMGDYLTKFDSSGNLVFFRDGNAEDAGPFRRNEIDGEVIYSYLERRSSAYHEPMNGVYYYPSVLVLLNERYEKIDEVSYMFPTDSVPENTLLGNHEHLVLGKDHYVIMTYVAKKVTNIPENVRGSEFGANVAACVFQEIKNDELVFEWDSTEHPELYALSTEACDYTNQSNVWADYAHLNAISIDPADGNFLCSFRNFNSILKVDRETGEILWILGGLKDEFGITDDQQFHRQHNVSVTEDGYLMMFDNGCLLSVNNYPKQTSEEKAALDAQSFSRVLKFKLDEENMKILNFKEYIIEDFYSASMGSAQVMDNETDTILIGWGGKSRVGMPYFQEINFETQTVNFEMLCNDSNKNCYRATYYDK